MAGLLRHARRQEGRLRRGDQEGLPQACAQVAPGREPGRRAAPRSASRRSRRRTRSCPTPRSASSTTPAACSAAGPGGRRFRFDPSSFRSGVRLVRRHPLRPVRPRRRRRRPARPRAGRDLETEVRLSFAQAMSGTEVSVSVPVEAPCPTCHGSGAKPGTSPRDLPPLRRARRRDRGPGHVLDLAALLAAAAAAAPSIDEPCPTCGGARPHRTRRSATA